MTQNIYWENVDVVMHNDDSSSTKQSARNEIEFKNLAEKPYIPQRSYKTFFKPSYITISLAIIVFTVITVTAVILIRKNIASGSKKLSIPYSSGLIINDNKRFWTVDTITSEATLLQEVEEDISTFDIYEKNTIYWLKKNIPVIRPLSQGYPNITHMKRCKPQAIAVDFVTEKLYIIDKSSGTVSVIDMEGKYYGIILSDLEKPHDIALDLMEGLMFISQFSNSILRSQMDGTQLTKIIENRGISAITVDRKKKKIYWSNDYISIESSDYDGKNRVTLTISSINTESLAIFENQLFWLWPAHWNHNATLWSCKVDENICKNHVKHPISFVSPKIMKMYPVQYKSERAIENPCKKDNGGCTHLCLLSSRGNRSCACNLGWQLNSGDLKSCQYITEFILYTKGNFIKGKTINPGGTFIDAILPIEITIESLRYKDTIDFDYILEKDEFYFSGDKNIYKINIMTDGEQVNILKVEPDYYIKDIAIDWLSKNLYFSKRSENPLKDHSIVVVNIEQKEHFQKNILSFSYMEQNMLQGCPYSLVIHANKGYLFFTRWYGVRDIHKSLTNGLELQSDKYGIGYVNKFKTLAIDYEEDKMYFIKNKNSTNLDVYRVELEDVNKESYYCTLNFENVTSIYVYKQYIYTSNSSSIWRFDKQTCGNGIQIAQSFKNNAEMISGAKIFSPAIQLINGDNLCAVNKGNCEKFCFSKPYKSCG